MSPEFVTFDPTLDPWGMDRCGRCGRETCDCECPELCVCGAVAVTVSPEARVPCCGRLDCAMSLDMEVAADHEAMEFAEAERLLGKRIARA